MTTKPQSDAILLEAVDALELHDGVQARAARALNIPRTTLQSRVEQANLRGIISSAKQMQALHGNAPGYDMTHPVPAPFIVRGTSTLYDKDGKLTQQWVKTKLDDQKLQAAIQAAIAALSGEMQRLQPSAPPNHYATELCNLYTLTDCHVGMYAWEKETGADWDLEIAETMLTGAFDYLIEATPTAKTGIVLNLGDFMHYDSLNAVTPMHNNLLDADSRFSKMVGVAVKILRHVMLRSLQKHEQVIAILAEGNHDPASSVWLRHLFRLIFENEPRITIIDNETPYIVHQHGNTMLAFHHGHLNKPDQLPLIFAAQYSKIWGETTFRYCHTGHQHHVYEKEHAGIKVKQHATLAARDAYAARGGWIAARQLEAITYHADYGQVGSIIVTPEMLKGK